MSAMVVGGDYLGIIEKRLEEFGINKITHITGRKPSNIKKAVIPKNAAFVMVFTDYVNHNTMKVIKEQAKALSVPLVFTTRSWGNIEKKLTQLDLQAKM